VLLPAFADQPENQRTASSSPAAGPDIVRLSVGLKDVEHVIADLGQAIGTLNSR
jgi:cystathionine beta-lyase/cystathionine gamma-synthase